VQRNQWAVEHVGLRGRLHRVFGTNGLARGGKPKRLARLRGFPTAIPTDLRQQQGARELDSFPNRSSDCFRRSVAAPAESWSETASSSALVSPQSAKQSSSEIMVLLPAPAVSPRRSQRLVVPRHGSRQSSCSGARNRPPEFYRHGALTCRKLRGSVSRSPLRRPHTADRVSQIQNRGKSGCLSMGR
jgi:hypothetical protein